jgi:hypothetical protein
MHDEPASPPDPPKFPVEPAPQEDPPIGPPPIALPDPSEEGLEDHEQTGA